MKAANRRLDKVEAALLPKQQVLRWLDHAFSFGTDEEYFAWLMKQRLAKRVKQIGQLSAAWDEVIPPFLGEYASLVSYARGTLTVAVDSAPHRYQLNMLIQNGLLSALRERFHGGPLNRVRLVPGRHDYLEFPSARGQA
jgi:hypothetical protein